MRLTARGNAVLAALAFVSVVAFGVVMVLVFASYATQPMAGH